MPAGFLGMLWVAVVVFCGFVALDPGSVDDWVSLIVLTFALVTGYYLKDECDRQDRA